MRMITLPLHKMQGKWDNRTDKIFALKLEKQKSYRCHCCNFFTHVNWKIQVYIDHICQNIPAIICPGAFPNLFVEVSGQWTFHVAFWAALNKCQKRSEAGLKQDPNAA